MVVSAARVEGDYLAAGASFAKLELSSERAVRWELARRLGRAKPFYAVDAGTGSFMDAAAVPLLEKLWERDPKLHEKIDSKRSREHLVCDSSSFTLDESTGINFVYFTSGAGDGAYASYFGYSADGHIVELVTDFGVLDDDPIEGWGQKAWWQFWT